MQSGPVRSYMKKDKKVEAGNWLAQAGEEFKDAVALEERGRFYLALYLYQQSAEKALKAYLYSQGEEELFTHSVKDLLDMAVSFNDSFNEVKEARYLDRYYIPTRYPNGLAGNVPAEFFDDPKECRKAQGMAKKTIGLVKKIVK